MEEYVGNFEEEGLVLEMCQFFLEDEDWARNFSKGVSLPISPAELQVLLMRELQSPKHRSPEMSGQILDIASA